MNDGRRSTSWGFLFPHSEDILITHTHSSYLDYSPLAVRSGSTVLLYCTKMMLEASWLVNCERNT